MAGYHINEIPRGVYGELSKIKEELAEVEDAAEQGVAIMELVELSDLVGAIEAYAERKHGMRLTDLIDMMHATKRAFMTGGRK